MIGGGSVKLTADGRLANVPVSGAMLDFENLSLQLIVAIKS